jgi:hypothetical protein
LIDRNSGGAAQAAEVERQKHDEALVEQALERVHEMRRRGAALVDSCDVQHLQISAAQESRSGAWAPRDEGRGVVVGAHRHDAWPQRERQQNE